MFSGERERERERNLPFSSGGCEVATERVRERKRKSGGERKKESQGERKTNVTMVNINIISYRSNSSTYTEG